MKYAWANLLLGLCLMAYGLTVHHTGWVLMWLGACFAILGLAYGCSWPRIFGKQHRGYLSWWSWVVFFPLHLYSLAVWHLIRLLSREPIFDPMTKDITIGRRVLPHELPMGTEVIVDLTAEFAEPAAIRSLPGYHHFPILDASTPLQKHLVKFIRALPPGRLYIHCAQGHGRTALFTLALLKIRRPDLAFSSAQEMLLRARPGARMNALQQLFIGQLFNTPDLTSDAS